METSPKNKLLPQENQVFYTPCATPPALQENYSLSIKIADPLPWSNHISYLIKQETLAVILMVCIIIIGTIIAVLSLFHHPISFGITFIPVFAGTIGLMILSFPLMHKKTHRPWISEINKSFEELQDNKIKEIQDKIESEKKKKMSSLNTSLTF